MPYQQTTCDNTYQHEAATTGLEEQGDPSPLDGGDLLLLLAIIVLIMGVRNS